MTVTDRRVMSKVDLRTFIADSHRVKGRWDGTGGVKQDCRAGRLRQSLGPPGNEQTLPLHIGTLLLIPPLLLPDIDGLETEFCPDIII